MPSPSTPSNLVPLLAAVPHEPSQARTWVQRQRKGSLDAFQTATSGPDAALAPAAAAAFDVLAATTAFVARTKPTLTAEELGGQIDAYHCDISQDMVGDHTAQNLALTLRPLLSEAARALRARRLPAAQPALIAVLHQSLTAYVALDPDLHAMPVLQLYEALHARVAAGNPRGAVMALQGLRDLIWPAVVAVNAPVAPPLPPPTTLLADLKLEIRSGRVGDDSPYTTAIARLEARRAQMNRAGERDEQRLAWIATRLELLHWQRQVVCALNGPAPPMH